MSSDQVAAAIAPPSAEKPNTIAVTQTTVEVPDAGLIKL
jgi:hypothetical protein